MSDLTPWNMDVTLDENTLRKLFFIHAWEFPDELGLSQGDYRFRIQRLVRWVVDQYYRGITHED